MTPQPPRGAPVRAALVMLILSLLLFWIPLVGPLIAGFVGGRIARVPLTATLIALLPAIIIGLLVGFVLGAVDLPVLGTIAGGTAFLIIAFTDLPLLIGAYAGAATSA